MKLDYIFIKQALLLALALFAFYPFIVMIVSISSKPPQTLISFEPINQSNLQSLSSMDEVELIEESSSFDYEVVGYRAGISRSSVIVVKDNKSFAVQQGELLENKYKLVSVNDKFANFEYLEKKFQLKTNLLNEE